MPSAEALGGVFVIEEEVAECRGSLHVPVWGELLPIKKGDVYNVLSLFIISGMGMEGRAIMLLNICRS